MTRHNTPLPDKARLDRLLAQAKQTEVMVIVETRDLQRLRAERSPWTQAREIRARSLLGEIDDCLKILRDGRRDLLLRLKMMSHAVEAARAYSKIGHATR